ncbi:Hypothetical predicted protein [Paramuricea clavata]|nr:Hypothetical predicted protein [Paramuricea clavata]
MTLIKRSLFVIFILAEDVVSIQMCADKWKGWGNSCYLFVTSAGANYDPPPSNWNMSRAYCLNKGADLVSLTTNGEFEFVYSNTNNLAYWIGLRYKKTKLRKDAHWAWSNGDKLNFTEWNKGEPNNLETEHCVEILKGLKFWNNKGCDKNQALAWICEKPRDAKTSLKTVKKIPSTAPSKPTTTTKRKNSKPSIITSTKGNLE